MVLKNSKKRAQFLLFFCVALLIIYFLAQQTIQQELSQWRLRRYLLETLLHQNPINDEKSYERKTLAELDLRNKQKMISGFLLAALQEPDKDVRFNAVYLLSKFPEISPEIVFPAMFEIFRKDSDDTVRSFSLVVLNKIAAQKSEYRNSNFFQFLKECLQHPSSQDVLEFALGALPEFYPKESLPLILPFFKHKDKEIRLYTIVSMKGIQEESLLSQVIPQIMVLCKEDPEVGVRLNALGTLEDLHRPEFLPVYFDVLYHDANDYIRYSASSTLEKLQLKESIPELKKAITHPDAAVVLNICNTLIKMGEKDPAMVPILIEIFKRKKYSMGGHVIDTPVWLVLSTLKDLGPLAKAAIPLLREAFEDPLQPTKGSIAETLFLIESSPEHTQIVERVLEDEREDELDERGGLLANLTYAAIHSKADITAIHPLLMKLKNSPDRQFRRVVMEAFPWTASKEVVIPLLLQFLSDEEKEVRRAALSSLILLQSEKMDTLFQSMLAQESLDIRLDAIWGLKEFGKKTEYLEIAQKRLSALLQHPQERIQKTADFFLKKLHNRTPKTTERVDYFEDEDIEF